MTRLGWIARVLLAGAALATSSCDARGARDVAARPDIVLMTLDTTRADHMGSYGYFRETTPRFDALAAESIVFERMIAPMATTLPSHLSILTSSHPLEHGVLANTTHGGRHFVPAPGLLPFPVIARQAGYATAAFVSAGSLKRGSGIELGFETFDEPATRQRRGGRTADAALAWLAAQTDRRPIFLWVHFYDAHYPLVAPPRFAARFRNDDGLERFIAARQIRDLPRRGPLEQSGGARDIANRYDAELLYQDFQLGRVLDALRARGEAAWARTAVLIVGDHGEGLGQHGEGEHGGTWDEQLRVPLVMRIPGETPRRIGVLLGAEDILPSFLRRLDVPALEPFLASARGQDVFAGDYRPTPVLSQDTDRERSEPFKYALTGDTFKYFRVEASKGLEERLFDLAADPYELRDVSAERPDLLRSMREHTLSLIEERRERGAQLRAGAPSEGEALHPERLRELCALGYLAGEHCEL
jgi:arylsulfatase